MLTNYYTGTCFIIFNIMLLCQGYPRNDVADSAFGYQESEEQNSALHNAMVSDISIFE